MAASTEASAQQLKGWFLSSEETMQLSTSHAEFSHFTSGDINSKYIIRHKKTIFIAIKILDKSVTLCTYTHLFNAMTAILIIPTGFLFLSK